MTIVYFEDINLGEKESLGNHTVTREEIVEFARKYDPLPIHLDEKAAADSPHKGIIASACLTMSLSAMILNQRPNQIAIIAGGGWDDVRFPNAVRPGDRLCVDLECVECRESKSKPDRGVVRYKIRMTNEKDEVVLTYKTTVIVSRRGQ